jgi:formylglycine-generating enzyme required for sulfatase activity
MKLVLIPAGRFTMGSPKQEQDAAQKTLSEADRKFWLPFLHSEGPQHEAEITKAFYLGVHEVTQKQFREVMGYNPSYFSKDGEGKKGVDYRNPWKPAGGKAAVKGLPSTDDLPVENVSWEEAVEFCTKLTVLVKEKQPGRVYRLPTEAEWEYACRGGASSYQPYHFGDRLDTTLANIGFGKPPERGAFGRTRKVGSYQPNGFGLFDMHGNVKEWCADGRSADRGGAAASPHVIRGGCFHFDAWRCRSASRITQPPDARAGCTGFRVALVVSSD